jgi:AraC-like DNA-binding protein
LRLIITILIWGALFQGLLLGVVFISTKRYSSYANKLLGCFLIAFVFQAFTDILPYDQIGSYSIAHYFTLPEVKWLLPLLFLHFVLEKLGRSLAYRLFLKAHYGLAFAIIALTVFNLLLFWIADTTLLELIGWRWMDIFYMSLQYYAFALTVVAFVIALRETLKYKEIVSNESSDFKMLDLKWLYQFIFLIVPIIFFWGAELTRIALGGTGQSDLSVAIFLFIAVFNYFVSYKALTRQTLFEESADRFHLASSPLEKQKKAELLLPSDLYPKIEKEMKDNGYFLDHNLTIYDFSRQLKIPARTLSSCINQVAGNNFNEWVNNFRVDKAIVLLAGEQNNYLSVEGVGAEAGFKSRSSMYMAFKKKTGKSPGYFKAV